MCVYYRLWYVMYLFFVLYVCLFYYVCVRLLLHLLFSLFGVIFCAVYMHVVAIVAYCVVLLFVCVCVHFVSCLFDMCVLFGWLLGV